ncbi:MAG: hypothetical protein ACP5O0_01470 [Acidimicrobiales bacterium]
MVLSPYAVGVADAVRYAADSSHARSIQSRAPGIQEWLGLVFTLLTELDRARGPNL